MQNVEQAIAHQTSDIGDIRSREADGRQNHRLPREPPSDRQPFEPQGKDRHQERTGNK